MNLMEVTAQLGRWAQQHPDLLLYGMGGFMALTLGVGLLGRPRRPPQTSQGSARWATPTEIRHAGLTAPHGVVVGRLGAQILHDDSDTHLLLVAPSRSGKGVGPIGCTLLTWQPSVLVFDPADGENYDFSHGWRQSLGQRVEQFTPKRTPHACLNVSEMIRLGSPQEFDDAWAIAASLLAPAAMVKENPTSIHFRRLATMLLTAAHLHLAYTEPPASLGKLWWMLTQRYTSLGACITAMQTYPHTAYGVHLAITQLATGLRNITGDRELGSVWSTAIGPLLPYADYLIQRSTDTTTVPFEALQYGPTPLSLYLVAPNTRVLERLAPVYRVISEIAMQRLQEHKARSAPHQLLVIADEAPAYGYSLMLDKGAAEAAKYGIKLLIVAQDIPQLDTTFGEHNNLWGNTATKIFFAPDSDVTARRLSEAWGRATVEQPVLSQPQGLRKQGSVSYQQVGRALLTADELRAMHRQAAIVEQTGLRPILCGKVNCRTDQEYRHRYQRAA